MLPERLSPEEQALLDAVQGFLPALRRLFPDVRILDIQPNGSGHSRPHYSFEVFRPFGGRLWSFDATVREPLDLGRDDIASEDHPLLARLDLAVAEMPPEKVRFCRALATERTQAVEFGPGPFCIRQTRPGDDLPGDNAARLAPALRAAARRLGDGEAVPLAAHPDSLARMSAHERLDFLQRRPPQFQDDDNARLFADLGEPGFEIAFLRRAGALAVLALGEDLSLSDREEEPIGFLPLD